MIDLMTGIPGVLAGRGAPAIRVAAGEERERVLGIRGDPFHDRAQGGEGRVGHGLGVAALEEDVGLVVLATQPALQCVRRHIRGRRAGGNAGARARHRDDLLGAGVRQRGGPPPTILRDRRQRDDARFRQLQRELDR